MSQENVEIVQQLVEAFNARDRDRLLSLVDPEDRGPPGCRAEDLGRGAGSGVPVSREAGALWQLRDGKLVKCRAFLDQREALEAAGLRE